MLRLELQVIADTPSMLIIRASASGMRWAGVAWLGVGGMFLFGPVQSLPDFQALRSDQVPVVALMAITGLIFAALGLKFLGTQNCTYRFDKQSDTLYVDGAKGHVTIGLHEIQRAELFISPGGSDPDTYGVSLTFMARPSLPMHHSTNSVIREPCEALVNRINQWLSAAAS